MISLEDIKSRLTALDQLTNGLTSEARLSSQLPCAFLVEDSCSIYEVRPLACRGGNSIDADLCRRHVEDMENVQKEEKREGRPYWIHAVPFHVMRVLREGLTTGMKKWDLGQEKLELTAATRIALQEKDAPSQPVSSPAVMTRKNYCCPGKRCPQKLDRRERYFCEWENKAKLIFKRQNWNFHSTTMAIKLISRLRANSTRLEMLDKMRRNIRPMLQHLNYPAEQL